MKLDYRQRIRAALRRFDIDIQRYSRVHEFGRRKMLLDSHEIDAAIDVGANTGRYGVDLRGQGFTGQIVSFEPVAEAYARLKRRADADPAWQCRRTAVGDCKGEVEIHVAGNLESSSLLPMKALHLEASPHTAFIKDEQIPIDTLDNLLGDPVINGSRFLMKIDVQGYERQVLDGAPSTIEKTHLLEIELSPVVLYEGQPLHSDLLHVIEEKGFELIGLKEMYVHPATGKLLSFDALFSRA